MARKKQSGPKPAVLSDAGRAMLDTMRNCPTPHRLYGRDAAACKAVVDAVFEPNLRDAPMQVGRRQQYYWFLAELVRLFRTRTGEALAMHCELAMRKWYGFGLDMETMQWLLGQVWASVQAEAAAG
jgi:hypothetical protein